MLPALPWLLLLPLAALAADAGNSSAVFLTTGITLNDVTKSVRGGGQAVVFENALVGADGAYQLRLQLKNAGSKTLAVQSLVAHVYEGSFNSSSSVPDGAAPLLSVPAQVRAWQACMLTGVLLPDLMACPKVVRCNQPLRKAADWV